MLDDLNALLQLIQTPAYFFDKETHRLVAVNAHILRLLDYTEAEMLAMTIEQFRPAEDIPKLRKAVAQGPPRGSVEWRYLTRSGALLYVQLTYRDSTFLDKSKGLLREVRMVVLSKWDTVPTRSADELFG